MDGSGYDEMTQDSSSHISSGACTIEGLTSGSREGSHDVLIDTQSKQLHSLRLSLLQLFTPYVSSLSQYGGLRSIPFMQVSFNIEETFNSDSDSLENHQQMFLWY